MTTSLNSLVKSGTELTAEQMRVVDGGILLYIVVYTVAYLHGYHDGSNS